jgi:hypothetical protein
MLHQLQQLMGSPTVFSKLEITTLVIVALAAGMVLGGLVGTSRRLVSIPIGYTAVLRGPGRGGRGRDMRMSKMEELSSGISSASSVLSDVASTGWAGAGLNAVSTGGGVWVAVAGDGKYHPGAQKAGVYRSEAYRSAAYRSKAYRSEAHRSDGYPSEAHRSDGYPSDECPSDGYQSEPYQPEAYQPDVQEADAIEHREARAPRKNRPLWRFGTALFSAARAKAMHTVTPPAGTARATTARPGRHRASHARTGRTPRTSMASTWVRTS